MQVPFGLITANPTILQIGVLYIGILQSTDYYNQCLRSLLKYLRVHTALLPLSDYELKR